MHRIMGGLTTLRRFFSAITIEPGVFFVVFSFGLSTVIGQNLLIDKVCRVDLNYNSSVCSDLMSHKEEQKNVQRLTASIGMWFSIFSSIPGVTLCLFVGPWSDVHGRKPLMVVSCVGQVYSGVVMLALTYFSNAGGYWYLLATGNSLFGGGFVCFLTAMFSYISDISDAASRSTRIAAIDSALYAGYPSGILTSGVLFRAIGFYGVFGLSCAVACASVAYFAFFVRETVGPNRSHQHSLEHRQDSDSSSRRGLFHWSHLTSVFKTCFKPRPHRIRRVILLLMLSILLNVTVFSTGNVSYLYTRLRLDWTEIEYSEWTVTETALTAICGLIFMWIFSFKLGVADGILGVIGTISGLVMNVGIAFSTATWMMYTWAAVGALHSVCAIVIRSMLSKVSPASDLGKIFSLLACLESVMPVLSIPVLTVVYEATLNNFPGAVYIAMAGIFFAVGTVLSYVHYLLSRPGVRYGNLSEEEDNENIADEDNEEDAIFAVGRDQSEEGEGADAT